MMRIIAANPISIFTHRFMISFLLKVSLSYVFTKLECTYMVLKDYFFFQ